MQPIDPEYDKDIIPPRSDSLSISRIMVILSILFMTIVAFVIPVASATVPEGCLDPGDLVYRGAFRVPGTGTEEYGWAYGGGGLTFFPGGDESGSEDGYPGSLFGMGHDQKNLVTEISIPEPVISPDKQRGDLMYAETLQPFCDLYAGLFVDSGQGAPLRGDLCYLPALGDQASGKLYFSFAEHMQYDLVASHAWADTDLSNPQTRGPWFIGSYPNFCTNDYLFEIPGSWAAAHAPGYRLATGRFRDGSLGGSGPALFAIAPWLDGNPPAPDGVLTHVIPLLLYEKGYEGSTNVMRNFTNADEWSGGAWITSGNVGAVVFAGTKGRGDCWYGFSDGTVWPDEPPYPPIPPRPANDRGWWAERFDGVLLFFNPDDLAAVASGETAPYQPQPYAELNIDPVLFHVTGEQQKRHLGAAAYDRENGYLYVTEFMADGEACLIHAWQVIPHIRPNTIGLFRPSESRWYLDFDNNGLSNYRVTWGAGTDIPVTGDWDNDGYDEIGLFRPSSATWFLDYDNDGLSDYRISWGSNTDKPITGDWDNDGYDEIGLFRPSSATWYLDYDNSGLSDYRVSWGSGTDKPVTGDWDNDGYDEIGLFRPSSATWFLDYDNNGLSNYRVTWGASTDIPVTGDWDNDGYDEIGLWRPSTSRWFLDHDNNGLSNFQVTWGASTDRPVTGTWT